MKCSSCVLRRGRVFNRGRWWVSSGGNVDHSALSALAPPPVFPSLARTLFHTQTTLLQTTEKRVYSLITPPVQDLQTWRSDLALWQRSPRRRRPRPPSLPASCHSPISARSRRTRPRTLWATSCSSNTFASTGRVSGGGSGAPAMRRATRTGGDCTTSAVHHSWFEP